MQLNMLYMPPTTKGEICPKEKPRQFHATVLVESGTTFRGFRGQKGKSRKQWKKRKTECT